MRVHRKVLEDLLRASERRLRVDNPLVTFHGLKLRFKVSWISQMLELAFKAKLSLFVGLLQILDIDLDTEEKP